MITDRLLTSLGLIVALVGTIPRAFPEDTTSPLPRIKTFTFEDVRGFENPGTWFSVPPDLLDQMEVSKNPEENLWSARERNYKGIGVTPAASLSELNGGLQAVALNARQGAVSGKWDRHAKFPSLMTRFVDEDWSGKNCISFQVTSEVDSGETLTLGILSDNLATPWKDWYFYKFTINFKGSRKISIPFKAFTAFEKPLGWNHVTGIGFFSKAFGHQPNPATVLYLDDLKATHEASPRESNPGPVVEPAAVNYRIRFYEQPVPLNHGFPEIAVANPVVTPEKALSHQNYFAYDRAVTGWYPKFQPGYVSFDAKGKAFIAAGDRIGWMDEKGKWVQSSVQPAITAWAAARGWKSIRNNWGGQMAEPMVRFDRDGDAYLLTQVTEIDGEEKETHWTNRTGLLLHSRDGMKTWKAYVVPGGRLPSFEKLEGHNEDCLNHPPVILNSDISYFAGTDTGSYLVLPEKNKDGTLRFEGPYKFGEFSCIGGFHSGDGNQVVSVGDKIFVTLNWVPDSFRFPKVKDALMKAGGKAPGAFGGGDWDVPHLMGTEAAATLPNIPPEHPAQGMNYTKKGETVVKTAKTGVPTFIRVFDRRTKKFSETVFLGYGGSTLDGHNWPALTRDSKGILHVLINGHHDPVVYTRSLKPDDTEAWSEPAYVAPATAALSYATFTCDARDNLYSVHRSTSDGLYNNRLGFYRKKAGGEWEPERTLVFPFKYMYMVWYQRMTYDRKKDRLFLTYYARGGQQQLAQDMYEFKIFHYPDLERNMAVNQGDPKKDNRGRISPLPVPLGNTGGAMYNGFAPGDLGMLVSRDQGDTWSLVTSEDFR